MWVIPKAICLAVYRLSFLQIVTLWGKGASAEETVKYLKEEGVKISLHGIYNLRRSLTANQIIDEDIRAQRRAINTASTFNPDHPQDYNPALAMKYRDKLLEKLMPHKISQTIEGGINDRVEIIDNRTVQDASKTA